MLIMILKIFHFCFVLFLIAKKYDIGQLCRALSESVVATLAVYSASSGSKLAAPSSASLSACPYGSKCYRKNPEHLKVHSC
jgi:hypothetical protein